MDRTPGRAPCQPRPPRGPRTMALRPRPSSKSGVGPRAPPGSVLAWTSSWSSLRSDPGDGHVPRSSFGARHERLAHQVPSGPPAPEPSRPAPEVQEIELPRLHLPTLVVRRPEQLEAKRTGSVDSTDPTRQGSSVDSHVVRPSKSSGGSPNHPLHRHQHVDVHDVRFRPTLPVRERDRMDAQLVDREQEVVGLTVRCLEPLHADPTLPPTPRPRQEILLHLDECVWERLGGCSARLREQSSSEDRTSPRARLPSRRSVNELEGGLVAAVGLEPMTKILGEANRAQPLQLHWK